MEVIQKLKRIARPGVRQLGEVLRRMGTELIRRSATGQLDEPLYLRYPGTNAGTVECRIAYNEHGGYCIPLSSISRPAAQRIFRGNVYEPATIECISRFCEGGDIIHAGTFFGDFLPPLANACAERVWAFEPNPVSYKCAEATIAINGLSSVVIENVGLGASNEETSLVIRDEQGRTLGGKSTVVSSERSGVDTVEVSLTRLDDVIPQGRRISVLQLDVEGYERQALEGGLETVRRCLPVLILERPPQGAWMEKNILSLGYEYAGEVSNNSIFRVK